MASKHEIKVQNEKKRKKIEVTGKDEKVVEMEIGKVESVNKKFGR